MSKPYDEYLKGHIANVKQGYQWLCSHFEDVRKKMQGGPDEWDYLFEIHDESKYDVFEYEAYDDYFYGGNKSYKVVKAFKRAWLHHIHHNPHHWQFWVLLNDDEGEECLEMPYPHAIEMICDWWSFSWKKGDLTEIFRWYEEHKEKMRLHEDTRKVVEDILGRMAKELGVTFNGTIAHHGIKGQKWGVRNGPPYPLDAEKSAKVRMRAKWGRDVDYDGFEMVSDDYGEDRPIEKLSQLKRLRGDEDILDVRMKINHGDSSNIGRLFNCANCALAFDMVERGYDVQARPRKNRSNVGDIEKYFDGGKLEHHAFDKELTNDITLENYNQMSYEHGKKVANDLLKQGDGARGIMVLGLLMSEEDLTGRTNAFHAVNYKVENGKVLMFDPQSRKDFWLSGVDDWADGADGVDPREWFTMRTDNLKVNENIADAIYSSGK